MVNYYPHNIRDKNDAKCKINVRHTHFAPVNQYYYMNHNFFKSNHFSETEAPKLDEGIQSSMVDNDKLNISDGKQSSLMYRKIILLKVSRRQHKGKLQKTSLPSN